MRIGIDLDDTICRTTEKVHEKLEEYGKKEGLNPLDIMNDDLLKEKFYDIYLEEIYKTVEIKRNVSKVLNRIKNRGNELYIITARSKKYLSKERDIDIFSITDKWLSDNNIKVDGIIISAYGERKASACKRLKIDLMIDDDPYNYKKIVATGTKCLLFDDRERYDLRKDYVTNWLDIESYIERNR